MNPIKWVWNKLTNPLAKKIIIDNVTNPIMRPYKMTIGRKIRFSAPFGEYGFRDFYLAYSEEHDEDPERGTYYEIGAVPSYFVERPRKGAHFCLDFGICEQMPERGGKIEQWLPFKSAAELHYVGGRAMRFCVDNDFPPTVYALSPYER